jgi:hypothetical protein
MDTEYVSLTNLAGGAAVETFDDALQRVLENIQDPNTDAEVPRSVVLTVTIKPDKHRSLGDVKIQAATKTAPPQAVETQFFMGRSPAGLVRASEADINQMNLFRDPEPKGSDKVTPIGRTEGGEL